MRESADIIVSTNKYRNKKVLFVPDSIWGDLSGHRSSKYLVNAFDKSGIEIGIYASKLNYTPEQESDFKNKIKFYEKTEYSYVHNIFPSTLKKEFDNILDDFKPDYVFYMGTIKNKVSINLCIKRRIKYSYLPLTTEYYCVKDFAGLEDGPCFQCISSPFTSPLKNNCLGSKTNLPRYFKEIFFTYISKKRILNADKVIGYSNNQLDYLKKFGVSSKKTLLMPIFFDPETINGIESSSGDYFVMAGQHITAKGWHLIPRIIKKGKGIKYKLVMRNEDQAKAFIKDNNLEDYVDNGEVEIVLYLKTHKELLELVANSKGVLVPSYYATTGEFYLMEALGMGKPVIVFDAGIHKEVIQHKQNGMISKVGNLDSFYRNIIEVNDNKNLQNKLSEGAVSLFNSLLSYKTFKDSLNDYFF